MATEVTRNLYIDYDNAKTYLTANGVSLQINIAGNKVAIRHYMNGAKTGYATINSAGMDVLFPSDTAIPNKLDVEAYIGQMVSSSKNWVEFRIDGTALERFPGDTKEFTRTYDNAIVRAFRKNGTFMSYHNAPNTVNGTSVRHLSLTLYFTQYACSANAVGNGIQSASVSNSSPYEGDTVTFTPKLVNGATWDGWYSDAECTQLVSTEQNYSVSPSSDITLYAKATIEAVVYNCSAIAGENIASVSVSDESIVSGDSVTFTAQLNEHCTFDGWFSDSNYTTLVSTANPYTATITSDTTLYAKATKISYSINVGTAEHGTATVSANTAHYGGNVTFTFTPEDETWELYGWYSDEGFTQLVSESNPYTHSVTNNVVLYPKVGRIRYTATIKIPIIIASIAITGKVKIAALQYDQLTKLERRQLKNGNFEQIDQSKIIAIDSKSGDSSLKEISVSVKAPMNSTIAIWATVIYNLDPDAKIVLYIADRNYVYVGNSVKNLVVPYNYYTFVLQEDVEYRVGRTSIPCDCSAVAMDGVEYADVITPTVQGHNAVFEADLISGYGFAGWYSDEACTQLVSTDNPAQIITPSTGTWNTSTSLTLYAKATPLSSTTGIYLKRNGSWIKAKSVFKKTNGVWVEQEDLSAIFSGESSGTASNYVYGGSV